MNKLFGTADEKQDDKTPLPQTATAPDVEQPLPDRGRGHGVTHDADHDPIPELEKAIVDLAAETARALAAEAAEASARASADAIETAARIAADAAEATARAAADTALTTAINTEITNRTNADTALAATEAALDARVVILEAGFETYSFVASNQLLAANSTAFQDVTNMQFAVFNSGRYAFEMYIKYIAGAAPDLKIFIDTPAGASGDFMITGWALGGTNYTPSYGLVATTLTFEGLGADAYIHIRGQVTMGGTAGNVKLRAAENTSDASPGTIISSSWVASRRA